MWVCECGVCECGVYECGVYECEGCMSVRGVLGSVSVRECECGDVL